MQRLGFSLPNLFWCFKMHGIVLLIKGSLHWAYEHWGELTSQKLQSHIVTVFYGYFFFWLKWTISAQQSCNGNFSCLLYVWCKLVPVVELHVLTKTAAPLHFQACSVLPNACHLESTVVFCKYGYNEYEYGYEWTPQGFRCKTSPEFGIHNAGKSIVLYSRKYVQLLLPEDGVAVFGG